MIGGFSPPSYTRPQPEGWGMGRRIDAPAFRRGSRTHPPTANHLRAQERLALTLGGMGAAGGAGRRAPQLGHGCVLITGTNGKPTTARLVRNIAQPAGYWPVH